MAHESNTWHTLVSLTSPVISNYDDLQYAVCVAADVDLSYLFSVAEWSILLWQRMNMIFLLKVLNNPYTCITSFVL